MKVKTKIFTGVVAFLLGVVLLFTTAGVSGSAGKVSSVSASTRTVELNGQSYLDEQSLWDEFDESDVQTNDDGFEAVAWKSFDRSILDEIDLVGLDETEDTFSVRYEISYIDSEETVLLAVTLEGEDDIPVIETIPGLISYNPAGEADVLFVVDGDYIWLSEFCDDSVIDNVGWFTNLIKKAAKAIANTFYNLVTRPLATLVTKIAVEKLGTKAASYGAEFLYMNEELDKNGKQTGIYHAAFDCWQDKFGYIDLYDLIFDMFTYMDNGKFEFDANNDGNDDFVIWAWKGNYLNLGAGAELGIYKRWSYGKDIWVIDKNFAMTMTLKLEYYNNTIIDWTPGDKQWWITGFNSNSQYLNVRPNQLTATFEITFNMEGNKEFTATQLYNAFKEEWEGKDKRWTFSPNSSERKAILEL